MGIDINKLRLSGKQVSGISGYVADGQLGSGKGIPSQTAIDVNKFADKSCNISKVAGFQANTTTGDTNEHHSQAASNIDTGKLRTTGKQVSSISGFVRGNLA